MGRVTHIPEHNSWRAMRTRCNNPNYPQYNHYGGRGIKHCERWSKFDNFLEDMGKRPPGTSLARIDNDEGYSPENCVWATAAEQLRNRTDSIHVMFDGEKYQLAELCEIFGIHTWKREGSRIYKVIRARISLLGWSVEDALFTPTVKNRRFSPT